MNFRNPANQRLYQQIMSAKLYRRPDGTYYSDNPVMNGLIQVESGGKANAKNPNSSAQGLLQFIIGTGREYGLVGNGFDKRNDPYASFEAGKRLAINNLLGLDRNGVVAQGADIYLAHQQGLGGALELIRAKNGGPVSARLRRNMVNNGGVRSGADFYNFWTNKYNKAAGLTPQGGEAVVGEGSIPNALSNAATVLTGGMASPSLTPAPSITQPLQELGVSYTSDNGGILGQAVEATAPILRPQDIYTITPAKSKRTQYEYEPLT